MALSNPAETTPQDDPSDPRNAEASAAPQQSTDLFSRWNSWLDKPANQVALTQFGLSMLGPLQPGEGLLSHGASAAGQAGEAVGRMRGQEQEEQKLRDTSALKQAQAEKAMLGSTAAGEKMDLQRQRLEETQRHAQEMEGLTGFERRRKLFSDYKADITPNKPKFEEWVKEGGFDLSQGGAKSGAGGVGRPATYPMTRVVNDKDMRNQVQQVQNLARDPKTKDQARAMADKFIIPLIDEKERPQAYRFLGIQ
jgi:hypothetical protein